MAKVKSSSLSIKHLKSASGRTSLDDNSGPKLQLETKATARSNWPKAAMKALKRSHELDVPETIVPGYPRSRWLRAAMGRKVDKKTLLKLLEERVMRNPSRQVLKEGFVLLNELCRTVDGASLVRRWVTQAKLNRLISGD